MLEAIDLPRARFVALKPGAIPSGSFLPGTPTPDMRAVSPGDEFSGCHCDPDALADDLALGHIALAGTAAAREASR